MNNIRIFLGYAWLFPNYTAFRQLRDISVVIISTMRATSIAVFVAHLIAIAM
jgi:hypothetical protein